jgi:hypothetical protein
VLWEPQRLSARCCPVYTGAFSPTEESTRTSAAVLCCFPSIRLYQMRIEDSSSLDASAALLAFAPRVFVETLTYFDGLLMYRIAIRWGTGQGTLRAILKVYITPCIGFNAALIETSMIQILTLLEICTTPVSPFDRAHLTTTVLYDPLLPSRHPHVLVVSSPVSTREYIQFVRSVVVVRLVAVIISHRQLDLSRRHHNPLQLSRCRLL